MENGGHCDDREIDNRSVLHYELGSYEKTKTTCFRGTLTFSLRYDFIHRVLMLHVIRANHLNNCQDKASAPHPYVKMYLLPERRNHCKTRMIKKASDPEFNEMFSFDVSYNNLPNRMLQVSSCFHFSDSVSQRSAVNSFTCFSLPFMISIDSLVTGLLVMW